MEYKLISAHRQNKKDEVLRKKLREMSKRGYIQYFGTANSKVYYKVPLYDNEVVERLNKLQESYGKL